MTVADPRTVRVLFAGGCVPKKRCWRAAPCPCPAAGPGSLLARQGQRRSHRGWRAGIRAGGGGRSGGLGQRRSAGRLQAADLWGLGRRRRPAT